MKKFNIIKLRDIYKVFAFNNCKGSNKKIFNFSYLNLSIRNSRDNRNFDDNNFKLLKNLSLDIDQIKSCQTNNLKISGYFSYISSIKELYYLPRKNLYIQFFTDLLRYFKQFLDILGICLIIIFVLIVKILTFSSNSKLFFKNKKIYSIYYWINKNYSSAEYYYKGIHKDSNNKVFISSFADTKLISKGLLISLKKKNFISPANILNIFDLIISILQFLHLYLYDLFCVFFKSNISFLSFWFNWKKAAEIFYSILVFNAIIKLSKNSHQCEFISWYESHITNNSFSLGVSYAKNNLFSSSTLSTFNGALITENIPHHFLPTKLDQEIGFLGDKYYVQDKSSKDEFESYLKANEINIEVQIVPYLMKRTNTFLEDKKFLKKSRFITIFTHDSYWDLVACILSLFNKKNKNLSLHRKLIKKAKIIFIRLHPSLDKEIALKEIYRIKEIPNDIRFEFISNKEETFIKSIQKSEYCYFGISIYINLAIELNSNVVCVETSHIYKPPIKNSLLNSSKLQIALPW